MWTTPQRRKTKGKTGRFLSRGLCGKLVDRWKLNELFHWVVENSV